MNYWGITRGLKEVMPFLVGENQTTFNVGMQIINGVLIGNKVITCLRKVGNHEHF